MFLARLLFFIMKHFRVSFDKEFVFGVIQLSSTYPVRKKKAHVGIETPNKDICENAWLRNIKQLVIPNGYIQVVHNESVTIGGFNFF